MDLMQSRLLEQKKSKYISDHGRIHPEVEAMPAEVQLRLLEQAESEGVELSAAAIEAELGDIDARIDVVRQAAALLAGGDHE